MTKQAVQKKTPSTVQAYLNKHKEAILAAIPRLVNGEALFRAAIGVINKSPKLQQCTPESLFYAIAQSSILGLSCDSALGQAHLVPYKKNVTLIIGYRGYIKMARNSGDVDVWYADIIYEGDKYDIQRGLTPNLVHSPDYLGKRATPLMYYSVVHYKNGSKDFEVMTQSEVDDIKKRSPAAADGPWNTDPEEMGKKTVMRRHSKRLPLSAESERAMELENQLAANEKQDFTDAIDVIGGVVPMPTEEKSPMETKPADEKPAAPAAKPESQPEPEETAPPKEPSLAPKPEAEVAPTPEPAATVLPPAKAAPEPDPEPEPVKQDPGDMSKLGRVKLICQKAGLEACQRYLIRNGMLNEDLDFSKMDELVMDALIDDEDNFIKMIQDSDE